MGLSARILAVYDDDTVERISATRFEKFQNRSASGGNLEYAGKTIRIIHAVIEFENRKPIRILHATFSLVPFDSEGFVDSDWIESQKRLAVESISNESGWPLPDRVLSVMPRIAKMKSLKSRWKPDPGLMEEIAERLLR